MGRRLLLLGPPGAGKGTQASMLSRALGVPHISTGDMLRAAVAAGSDLGRRVESIMAAGEYVPDDLMIAVVTERLSTPDAACGYLLDGFPRTEAQAAALAADAIDRVILLDVGADALIARLAGRAADEGRADDTVEVIRRRLEVYEQQTAPLIDHYKQRDLLSMVDGTGTIEDVFGRIALALAAASGQ